MSKILIIDDDISFNNFLRDYLELHEHMVISAFDGIQGFRLYKSEEPDLIITDLVMPNEDGLGFLSKLFNNKNEKTCKIIAMSGGGQIGGEEYLNLAKAMGVDKIFQKPFPMRELQNGIEALLV